MPPQTIGGGQFGTALGGAGALKAAMQRRGIDTSVLDQMSPAAPGEASSVASNLPQTNPSIGQSLGPEAIPLATPTTPSQQLRQEFRSAEMQIALRALENTVKTEIG